MGFFILTLSLLLSSGLFLYIGNKKYNDDLEMLGCIFAVIFGLVFIVLICSVLTKPADFDSYKNEYKVTKELLDSYKGTEYGNMGGLTDKIIDINDRIAAHKAYHDNFWLNCWYSEDIGNLEPLTFNKN